MEIARREPFSIMSGRKRPLEILRQRFQSELVAVRRLLAEAHAMLPASSPSSLPAEEPPAKKRKASPPVPVKKMTPKQRNQLYGDLTKLAKLSESHVLPAHILELLKKHSRRGICDDYIEIEMCRCRGYALALPLSHAAPEKEREVQREREVELGHSHGNDIAEFVLRKESRSCGSDVRAPGKIYRVPSPSPDRVRGEHGGAALRLRPQWCMANKPRRRAGRDRCVLWVHPTRTLPSRAWLAANKMHAVQDAALVEMQKQLDKFLRERTNPSTHHQHTQMMAQDQEEDEDVDIVGGVSPLPIRPTPVQLVEEDEEYVDICGDASPVKNLGQDATISGSSGSDSGSSHQSVDSRPAPAERAAKTRAPTRDLIARASEILERRRKEETSRAREKARQELLETERTAMFNETLDEEVKALGIDQYNTARPDNLLRRMGLFLKLDEDELKA